MDQPRRGFSLAEALALIAVLAAAVVLAIPRPLLSPIVILLGSLCVGVAFHWRAGPRMFLWMALDAAIVLLLFAVIAFLYIAAVCSGPGDCGI